MGRRGAACHQVARSKAFKNDVAQPASGDQRETPRGERGVNGTGVDGRFGMLKAPEYFARANDESEKNKILKAEVGKTKEKCQEKAKILCSFPAATGSC